MKALPYVIRCGLAAVVTATMLWAVSPNRAEAVQTSIMDYEATVTSTLSAVNLKCQPPHNECSSIVAANEVLLGLSPGSIDLIAKFQISGNSVTNVEEAQPPFDGSVDLEPSWNCVDAGGASDGCTLQLTFVDIPGNWQIVKIIAKTGKIGSSNDDDIDGVFVRSNALLTSGIDDLQAAFISEVERDEWFTAIGGEGAINGKYSHVWVFGVETVPPPQVPEPGTLVLLGLGLLGLGAAGLYRRRR